jgi:hypothetical protein
MKTLINIANVLLMIAPFLALFAFAWKGATCK